MAIDPRLEGSARSGFAGRDDLTAGKRLELSNAVVAAAAERIASSNARVRANDSLLADLGESRRNRAPRWRPESGPPGRSPRAARKPFVRRGSLDQLADDDQERDRERDAPQRADHVLRARRPCVPSAFPARLEDRHRQRLEG